MVSLKNLEKYFASSAHQETRQTLPLLVKLSNRYARERPFAGQKIAFAHILVRNSMVPVEALISGGAEVFLCDAYISDAALKIHKELANFDIPVYSVKEAAQRGDLYLDNSATLARHKVPTASAEATRTGVIHYASIRCPVISADNSRAKQIEGFFGTGDSLLRAWKQLLPEDPLDGKSVLQFGYGKIGRGVAHFANRASANFILVEKDDQIRHRAKSEGLSTLKAEPSKLIERALKSADVVISVTGIPHIIGNTYPIEWLRANQPILVNLGAEDEFGPEFDNSEILGGKDFPLNFHLAEPTRNRYIDPALAAHVMALEAWVTSPESYPVGVHPLPTEMDNWLLEEWRAAWPEEDITGLEHIFLN